MNSNLKASTRVPLVGVIDPDAYGTGTYTTAWIDMSKFTSIMATVFAGTLGSSATLNAKLQQTTDSSLSPEVVIDVPSKAITALTQAGTDSDKQAVINCRADELTSGYRYVRLSMTVGVATSDAGASVHGFDAHYEPADDLASVDEVV